MLVMYFCYTDFSSYIVEPFFNISLSLSSNLSNSLDDYVAEQELTGDNLYNTQLYGPQRAKKSVRFLGLPPIVMVQLKRFEFNYNTNKNQKILHHFEYPDVIDFSKWQVQSDESSHYQLYAVLVHQGIKAESGHYYAYVKVSDSWYRFNDQEVSRASKIQVFDYNFGGQIDVVQFDARQFKVFNRKTVSNSTAYMLVYVKQQLKQQLLNSDPIYPQWLREHQIMKQQQRQQIRSRKNFYHDIQLLDWQNHFLNNIADFLGLIFRNEQQHSGKLIQKISKSERVEQWIKPYNENGRGVYLYLVTPEKIQYQTLVNMQHRKSSFQDLVRQPNCPIIMISLPFIAKSDSLIYAIKISYPQMKMGQEGENYYETKIKFHNILQINRYCKNSDLIAKLKEIYAEPEFNLRFFYEQKKQLNEIKDDKMFVKGPQMQRNILGIIIVQKIPAYLSDKSISPTIEWYNVLKNYVQIKIKSEDGKYDFDVEMDQNRSVESLRQYIFSQRIQQQDNCSSSDNIVLKAKLKKTAKNYVQFTHAKTIRDLIKNCDKENIIVFSFSNLKADQRLNQIEVKFMYRFPDFSFSEIFHVILDRKSDNQSFNIYQKIAQHQQVQKYKRIQNVQGIRMFLFSKDKNVINDIVFQNGHVHGKGQVAQVLQKQKGSSLIVEGYPSPKIEDSVCPILLHHRSQNDDKLGIPRYLQFNRSTKLTQIYDYILQMIKDEVYQWEEKKIKCNPMRLIVYAYYKDYYKGIQLADQARLQIQEQERLQKLRQKEALKSEKIIQQPINEKELSKGQAKQPQANIGMDIEHNTTQNGMKQDKVIVIDQEDDKSNHKIEIDRLEINQWEEREGQNAKQGNIRKNSKCYQVKLKPWQKTIQTAFPKVKVLKVVVRHTYLTKAQTAMKINVQ